MHPRGSYERVSLQATPTHRYPVALVSLACQHLRSSCLPNRLARRSSPWFSSTCARARARLSCHIHHSTPWSPAHATGPPILQLLWRHVMIAFFVKVHDPWFSNISKHSTLQCICGAIPSNVHLCNWRMTLPLALQGDSDKAGECSWNWLLLYHQEA